MSSFIVVFADGACLGNPGPGGWGAIVVLPQRQVIELGGRSSKTTNNKMELSAVGHALRHLEKISGPIELYSDSNYVIYGMTKWIEKWEKNYWKTSEGKSVANVGYWKRIQELVLARDKKHPIHWRYVPGHSGVPGNERADEIAKAFSRNKPISLFSGHIDDYQVPILKL